MDLMRVYCARLSRLLSRRKRVSVAALLISVLAVGVGMGWITRESRRQRDAVAAITRARGLVLYSWQVEADGPNGPPLQHPTIPRWFSENIGVDCFSQVTYVWFSTFESDDQLCAVATFRKLQHVDVNGSMVSDAGLAYFSRLYRLRILNLAGTNISDAGLRHLERLSYLEELNLQGTRVTEQGIRALQRKLPGTRIIP
jgi:hypothetical protein